MKRSLVLLAAALLLLPLAAPTYALHVAIVVLINAAYTIGVYFMLRMGYLSLGHAGYIALGAYTAALASTRFGLSPWVGIAFAPLVAGAAGWGLGRLTLRLRGIYFSLSVFAFGEIVNAAFRAVPAFGGPAGLAGLPRPSLAGYRLESHLSYYYLVLLSALACGAFLYRLQGTRFGFALLTLRTADEERLAQSIGIDTARHKAWAFAACCATAGLIGAVHAHYLRFVGPSIFTFLYSTDLVVFAMVGGLGSFAGPLIGAGVLTALGEQLFSVGYYKSLVYAVILIAIILALPGGLISIPERLRRASPERLRRAN